MVSPQTLLRNVVVSVALSFCVVGQTSSAGVAPDPSALFEQGEELVAANRLAEAEVSLASALALAPADSQIMELLAKVKARLGESKEAVKLFRTIMVSQPRSAQAHLNLALALADTDGTKEALLETEAAIRLDPDNARAHLNRARLLAEAHRPREARLEYARAERLAPADPRINDFWAMFEKDNDRPAAAVSLFAKVIDCEPENTRALLMLGRAQQQLGHKREAIAAWRRAIVVDPSFQEALYALAQALHKTEPDEAAQLLQRFNLLHAERQKEDRARELGNEAYASMQHQEWQAAVASLQEAIAFCASCSLEADLHQRLGLAECHSGNIDKCEQELRMALSLKPNDRETITALQWVAHEKKSKETAP